MLSNRIFWCVFCVKRLVGGITMLLSLKVENFRSLKNEVVFDLSGTSSSNHLSDHLIKVPNSSDYVVRTLGIYGPNASGKSNLLKVFRALNYLVDDAAALKEGESIKCYEPYTLCQTTIDAPTKFEIDFVVDELRYKYKIHFKKTEIILESLDCFYSKQPSNLFTRKTEGWENIKFGAQFKGGVKKVPFGNNNSYLSKIGLVQEAPKVIEKIYDYFIGVICPIGMNSSFNLLHLQDESFRDILVETTSSFLSLVDTGVKSIRIEENKNIDIKLPDDIPEDLRERIIAENLHSFKFEHDTDSGDSSEIDIEDESDGTRRLFELTPAIVSALLMQRVLVIDEIDHSMHPHLAALLVRLFNDSEVNGKNSQLIFSTHNIELMKPDRMRRDQIWFSEKNKGETNIFSLDDFDKDKVKTSSPFNKWYDEGRFGGTPSINYGKIRDYFIHLASEDEVDEPSEELFGDVNDIPEDLR
ncbi:ATP-binding protein [Enterobacter sp. WCHEn090032]|nr:ATP-binding protein [Enterobacter sp. WCHEn090032]